MPDVMILMSPRDLDTKRKLVEKLTDVIEEILGPTGATREGVFITLIETDLHDISVWPQAMTAKGGVLEADRE